VQNVRFSLKLVLLVLLSVLAIGLLFGCGDDSGQQTNNQASNSVNPELLQIDDILLDPRSFQQNVLATGTVTTFSAQGEVSLIGIVDNEHILMCRNLDCLASKIYAVNVSGLDLPEPGDVITMVGGFQSMGNNWIFSISDYTVNDNVIDFLQ